MRSRTLVLSLSRGNGLAGVRGGISVSALTGGIGACLRAPPPPTDNSGASGGTPDCSPGAGGSRSVPALPGWCRRLGS